MIIITAFLALMAYVQCSPLLKAGASLLHVAIPIAGIYDSYRTEKKYRAKLVDFLDKKEKVGQLLEHFTEEYNRLTNNVHELDSKVYYSHEILEFLRLRRIRTLTELLLKVSLVYRVLFEHLYPSLKDETALIISQTPEDQLYMYSLVKHNELAGKLATASSNEDNHCLPAVKLLDYYFKSTSYDILDASDAQILDSLLYVPESYAPAFKESNKKFFTNQINKLHDTIARVKQIQADELARKFRENPAYERASNVQQAETDEDIAEELTNNKPADNENKQLIEEKDDTINSAENTSDNNSKETNKQTDTKSNYNPESQKNQDKSAS